MVPVDEIRPTTRYVVNGVQYESLEDIPEAIRSLIGAGGDAAVPAAAVFVHEDRTITIDGTTYASIDEVPDAYRAFAERLLEDRDGNGVLDMAEFPYEVDGTRYRTLDEIPEPTRSAFRDELLKHDRAEARRGRPDSRAMRVERSRRLGRPSAPPPRDGCRRGAVRRRVRSWVRLVRRLSPG